MCLSSIIFDLERIICQKSLIVTKGVDLTGLLVGHKRRLGVWGMEVPQLGPGRGSGGRSPPEGLGDEVPQKLKLFVKLHIIFALKYNKQQLLLLLDKIHLP